jgi:hypothetical protein
MNSRKIKTLKQHKEQGKLKLNLLIKTIIPKLGNTRKLKCREKTKIKGIASEKAITDIKRFK